MLYSNHNNCHLNLKKCHLNLKYFKKRCYFYYKSINVDDRRIEIKLDLAKSNDKLDLSDCKLKTIPEEVYALHNLTELSLAGNQLTYISENIQNLKKLKKLVLAGNQLRTIPSSIINLKNLNGIWLHGNLIEYLPEEFGYLIKLERCSLSGNKLKLLPNSFKYLINLKSLDIAGNELKYLPDDFGHLREIEHLLLHGNLIENLPKSLRQCHKLTKLYLQGNYLKILNTDYLPFNLKEASFADNYINLIIGDFNQLINLTSLSLYGNNIHEFPNVSQFNPLQYLWLENNPLKYKGNINIKKLGLDLTQFYNTTSSNVILSEILPNDKGYFKLISNSNSKCLVIAFGSAPGVPNFANLLSRVSQKLHPFKFDILFIVDPLRTWYSLHDNFEYCKYYNIIQSITSNYDHIIMLGDSMGATATLLFSPLSTLILSFTPQIDLNCASMRPGTSVENWKKCYEIINLNLKKRNCNINIYTGSWSHDLDQVNLLDKERINWQVFGTDSHRLALYLDNKSKLVDLVASEIAKEVNIKYNYVKISNFF